MVALNPMQILFGICGALLGAMVNGFETIIIGMIFGLIMGAFIR